MTYRHFNNETTRSSVLKAVADTANEAANLPPADTEFAEREWQAAALDEALRRIRPEVRPEHYEAIIKEKVRRHLVGGCKLLPDETPVDRDFFDVMSKLQDHRIFKDAIKVLVEKAMDERDDLQDYPLLRQKLVDKINGTTC